MAVLATGELLDVVINITGTRCVIHIKGSALGKCIQMYSPPSVCLLPENPTRISTFAASLRVTVLPFVVGLKKNKLPSRPLFQESESSV